MLNLLFRSFQVHTHLDWHETADWLDTTDAPICLGWQDGELLGVLAASTALNSTCWIRIAAVQDRIVPNSVLNVLWSELSRQLRALGVKTVAVLVINDWLLRYLGELSFEYDEQVITLHRTGRDLPAIEPHNIKVRSTNPHELETVAGVDQAAFTPPWQLTLTDLRQANRIAAVSTVAQLDDTIVGYQISTLFRDTGHLARLAVLPSLQGQGIGAALLDDLIRRFLRRGVLSVTVNTQSGNQRSQRLYIHYGFQRTGYDLPVWKAKIE